MRATPLSEDKFYVTYNRSAGKAKPPGCHATVDVVKGIYQFGGHGIQHSLFQGRFSLGYADEWALIRDLCNVVEYTDFGEPLHKRAGRPSGPPVFYTARVDDIAKTGERVETPRGVRWLFPLSVFGDIPEVGASGR